MRVKLSYTVEDEDVLCETAKIINLSDEDMQNAVNLFAETQVQLKGTPGEKVVNINKCLQMVKEFRKILLNIDTRFSEVAEIIEGYDHYIRNPAPTSAAVEQESATDVVETD